MNKGAALIALWAVATVAVVVFGVMNMQPVSLTLFGATVGIQAGLLMIGCFFIGVASTASLAANRVAKLKASDKALTKWESEDQKLLHQVQTDREKQLEAKIATLEAALQKALKK